MRWFLVAVFGPYVSHTHKYVDGWEMYEEEKNKSTHYIKWCWHFRSDYAWLQRHQLLLVQRSHCKNLLNIIIFRDEIFFFAQPKHKNVMMPFVWVLERSKVIRFICMATINQIIKRKLIFICMFYSIVSLSLFCSYSKFRDFVRESFCLECFHSAFAWSAADTIKYEHKKTGQSRKN